MPGDDRLTAGAAAAQKVVGRCTQIPQGPGLFYAGSLSMQSPLQTLGNERPAVVKLGGLVCCRYPIAAAPLLVRQSQCASKADVMEAGRREL